MITLPTWMAKTPEQRLLSTVRDLLTVRSMSDFYIAVEEIDLLETEHSSELFAGRASDLWDHVVGLDVNTNDADDWHLRMQTVENEHARLTGRPVKRPWNLRTD